MNKHMLRFVIGIAVLATSVPLLANSEWQLIQPEAQSKIQATSVSRFNVDLTGLHQRLRLAPHQALQDFSSEIELPMPDGRLARFSIVEAPVMQPGLAQAFPQIKTYKVFGIDDPVASGRVDISPRGFYGMLHTSAGRVFIDPELNLVAGGVYLSRDQSAIKRSQTFSCGVHDLDFTRESTRGSKQRAAERIPGMLLQYDLAVAATEEYVAAVGPAGDVANAQAAIVTAINRVNQIYERDLGITLKLVANNNQLIEKSGNVSFSNFNPFAMFAENQCWIDLVIGETNYDIGHVFSTGGGGLATLGSVCSTPNKAKGVTGLNDPTGDPFYIDFVAHEIGHQFGAEHSFNGTTGSCGGINNRIAGSAMEPGSGSTIMAYAGICGAENLQLDSEDTFHANSISEINVFTGSVACDAQVATLPAGNIDPVLASIADFSIPKNTAFALSGSATDANGDTSTYQWDQINSGTASNANNFGSDTGDNPLFRSYRPQTTANRDFPAMGTQVNRLFDKAEVLPCNSRSMNFRLTARDGNSGQSTEDVQINVTATGPFLITSFNAAQTINSGAGPVMLTWDRADTNFLPVNCPAVDIELLTFAPGYTTYTAHTLLAATPNDEIEAVSIIPTTDSHPRARFRVRCSNNIFYDISDGDLDIRGTDFPSATANFDDTNILTFFNNGGTTSLVTPACANPRPAARISSMNFVDSDLLFNTIPASSASAQSRVENVRYIPASCNGIIGEGGDSGSFSWLWLLLMVGLAAAKYQFRLYRRQ